MITKDKKALSEIVSYTLLIVVALSLSVLVYYFVRAYIPRGMKECKEDVSLVIKDYDCLADKEINLTLQNKGHFNIGGFFARGRNESDKKITRKLIVDGGTSNEVYTIPPMAPGDTISKIFKHDNILPELVEIEIEPFITKPGTTDYLLCENAIITMNVDCS